VVQALPVRRARRELGPGRRGTDCKARLLVNGRPVPADASKFGEVGRQIRYVCGRPGVWSSTTLRSISTTAHRQAPELSSILPCLADARPAVEDSTIVLG